MASDGKKAYKKAATNVVGAVVREAYAPFKSSEEVSGTKEVLKEWMCWASTIF